MVHHLISANPRVYLLCFANDISNETIVDLSIPGTSLTNCSSILLQSWVSTCRFVVLVARLSNRTDSFPLEICRGTAFDASSLQYIELTDVTTCQGQGCCSYFRHYYSTWDLYIIRMHNSVKWYLKRK